MKCIDREKANDRSNVTIKNLRCQTYRISVTQNFYNLNFYGVKTNIELMKLTETVFRSIRSLHFHLSARARSYIRHVA